MASEKDKALRKKVMADNPQKMGESNADYQNRINKLFNAKNPDQPVAVGASTAQRREVQEKKKAKEEASRRNAKVDFKRDGILTRGSVYYTKDGKMVVTGTAAGDSVAPKEMYDRDGNLIYKGGQKVKGKDEGVVKRTDMPKKQEEKPKAEAAKPKAEAAKPKAQAAKPKPAPKREEVKMDKMEKREAAPIATKKPEIKLAQPKGEMKAKESETKETPRQAAARKRSAKKEGKQRARKDTRAAVAKERKEMKSLRDEIAVAKAQERGDKRVSRAKSKREKLEARLKALRS